MGNASTTYLPCTVCDGARTILRAGRTGREPAEVGLVEDCARCHGTGVEPCVECGAPATVLVDGSPYCHAEACDTGEAEFDAAVLAQDAARATLSAFRAAVAS